MSKLKLADVCEKLGRLKGWNHPMQRNYVIEQFIKKGRLKAEKDPNFGFYFVEESDLAHFMATDFIVPKKRGKKPRLLHTESQS